jgi:hypothetical protein
VARREVLKDFIERQKLTKSTLTLFLIGIFWLINLPRTVPLLEADRGLFVSYAERLLAGDKLYVDLFFPKDPVFVWVIAAGRILSPLMDIFFENLWLLIAAYSVYQISKCSKLSAHFALLLGFLVTPLILTSGQYYPGYTHLPGIALTFLGASLLLKNHFFAAGVVLASIFFTKVMLFPIAVLVYLSCFISHWKPRIFLHVCVGTGFGVLFWTVILFVRGELAGYVQMLRFNSVYANDDIYPNWPLPLAHILRASNSMSWTSIILVVLILVWTFSTSNEMKRRWRLVRFQSNLWLSTLLGLASSLLVLAFTGMWNHHNQVLYVPAIFGSMLLASKLPNLASRKLSSFTIFLMVAIVLGGPKQGVIFTTPAEMRVAVEKLRSVPDEAKALASQGKPSTYARLGSNDDFGHAKGLREWTLSCPYFEFYPKFADSQSQVYASMLRCLREKTPQYVLVSTTFREWLTNPGAYGQNNWKIFVDQVKTLLSENYTCELNLEVLVCERNLS